MYSVCVWSYRYGRHVQANKILCFREIYSIRAYHRVVCVTDAFIQRINFLEAIVPPKKK